MPSIFVRCQHCLKKLSYSFKLVTEYFGEDFMEIMVIVAMKDTCFFDCKVIEKSFGKELVRKDNFYVFQSKQRFHFCH